MARFIEQALQETEKKYSVKCFHCHSPVGEISQEEFEALEHLEPVDDEQLSQESANFVETASNGNYRRRLIQGPNPSLGLEDNQYRIAILDPEGEILVGEKRCLSQESFDATDEVGQGSEGDNTSQTEKDSEGEEDSDYEVVMEGEEDYSQEDADFENCVNQGGRVRRVSGPSEEHGLAEDEYVNYCFLDGKSYRGEVKKKKSE